MNDVPDIALSYQPHFIEIDANRRPEYRSGGALKAEIRQTCNQRGKRINVRLKIFNISGQEVDILLEGHLPGGEHTVQWQASGVYFYRLRLGSFAETRRLVLMR